MSEFNNRVSAQRTLLQIVNARRWRNEDLFGLSSKAIERWVSVNRIDPDCALVNLIYSASEKLYFLANKSQEQISDEYKMMSKGFADVLVAVKAEMTNVTLSPLAPELVVSLE